MVDRRLRADGRGTARADGDRCNWAAVARSVGESGVGGAGVLHRRFGGLAALHTAADDRRPRGSGGAVLRRPRGHRALALAAGAGAHLVAAAGVARAAWNER